MCDDITCDLHLAGVAGMDDITCEDQTYDDLACDYLIYDGLNPECVILGLWLMI